MSLIMPINTEWITALINILLNKRSGGTLQQDSYRGNLVGTVKVLGGYGVVTGLTRR